MADIEVILNVEPMSKVDNIVIGNKREEEKVVIGSIVRLGDVVDYDTTDERQTLSDVPHDDSLNMIQEIDCSNNFESKNKNLSNMLPGSARKKRHRRGRSKKRKWKPYNKLTWDEKKQLEDRESMRAHRIRAERFAHGKPVAPYNTTQFLMDDHNVHGDLGALPNDRPQRQRRESGVDSDIYYSSPEDEEEFLQKEFKEVYENARVERLSSMSKKELIQEYRTLEEKVELLEKKMNDQSGCVDEQSRHLQTQIQSLEEEVERLKSENNNLKTSKDPQSCTELEIEWSGCDVTKNESCTEVSVSVEEDEKETQLNTALTNFSVVENGSDQPMDADDLPNVSPTANGETKSAEVDQMVIDSSSTRDDCVNESTNSSQFSENQSTEPKLEDPATLNTLTF